MFNEMNKSQDMKVELDKEVWSLKETQSEIKLEIKKKNSGGQI